MSSAVSTKGTAGSPPASATDTESGLHPAADGGIRPWQFFVLAALGCATAVTWMARSQGATAVVLLTVLMGTAALVALAAYRVIGPLLSTQVDRTAMIGQRTRVALEREKLLTLRAIKDLEFDRAMKKVSDDDFREMAGVLRARASRLMSQLDAGVGYRARIERDLAKRLGERPAGEVNSRDADSGGHGAPQAMVTMAPIVTTDAATRAARACGACLTSNDVDARFCKQCGAKL